jgi:hypothetical protein
MTGLESFPQVNLSMTMKEKLRQIKSAICVNRRIIKKTAHTRREAVARADNPYSLIAIFGRGHFAVKAGEMVYVMSNTPMEVTPRSHRNCTEEILALHNRSETFVDPISYV